MDVVISASNGPAIAIMPSPLIIDQHLLRVPSGGSVSNGPRDWEPTTKAKRLICNDSVSNGPCDQDYVITNRPLRPLPLRLPIRRGNLREGGWEKNLLTTPDVPCPVPRSSSARAGLRPLATPS